MWATFELDGAIPRNAIIVAVYKGYNGVLCGTVTRAGPPSVASLRGRIFTSPEGTT